jgi:cell division protein FtsB
MDWKLYEENKKQKEETEKYRVLCRVLGVIILVICFLWYRSDKGRIKWVDELQDQIAEYEEKIDELHSEIEGLKEEYGI